MGEELELAGPFEVDPVTGNRLDNGSRLDKPIEHSAAAGGPPQIPA
jgi:hypothetical protein